MSSKYVPPSMRLKNGMTVPLPDLNDIVSPTERKKQQDGEKYNRKNNYRKRNNYSKPQWEVEKEAAEKAEREKKEAAEKAALENTEENFPSLSRGVPKTNSWGGGRKFSELAVEWKAKADEDAVTQNVTEKDTSADGLILPKFNNVHRFHEPEEKALSKTVDEKNPDDEWKTVRRKVYIPKKKTVGDEIKEEEEKPESDDTVWATEEKEEHETCWDERRY